MFAFFRATAVPPKGKRQDPLPALPPWLSPQSSATPPLGAASPWVCDGLEVRDEKENHKKNIKKIHGHI